MKLPIYNNPMVLTKPNSGLYYHARQQPNGKTDDTTICGFYPGKYGTTNKHNTRWLEATTVELDTKNKDAYEMCSRCIHKLEAGNHELFVSVGKVLS